MPAFIDAALEFDDIDFVISKADNISDELIRQYVPERNNIKILPKAQYDIMKYSDFIWACSGTVTLETAIMKKPMIIAYRGPWIFYLIYLAVRCIKMISLPNIISGRLIVPELIMQNVNPDCITYHIEKILYDTEYRTEYINELSGVKSLLSDKISSKEAAAEIIKSLEA